MTEKKKVLVFIADGSEEAEAIIPVDMLRRAGADVTLVGVPDKTVKGAHGISIVADISGDMLGDSLKFDMMVLPGGMPGTLNLGRSSVVKQYIGLGEENGSFICAICAAPTVLGENGILKGKKATCYPGFEEKLAGAETCANKTVRDGRIITSRGPGTAFDFSFTLIEALFGKETSEKIKNSVIG